jgi:outer membrane protein TolC
MHKVFGLFTISTVAFLASPAGAETDSTGKLLSPAVPGGLTSSEVAARARATSYRAAQQSEALAQAEARLDQALVAYYPKLTLSAVYQRN